DRAVASAEALVASNSAQLMGSPGEAYWRGNVITNSGLTYVPYNRTYRGIPVVGGDFVVVTNAAGAGPNASVAQQYRIGSLGTTPSISSAKAELVARHQLTTVSSIGGTQLIVYALGDSPRLAWQSTVVGTGAAGYSRLTVTVDALTGAVL